MSGHREMYFAAREAGIKPILGVEAYISSTDRFDRRANAKRQDGTSAYNHVTLLAQNQTGLTNLYKLSEVAWTEGFYSKPRIDTELLEAYSPGLIVLTGCLNGIIAKRLEMGDDEGALAYALQLKDIFGENVFMEVQSHNPPEINHKLLSLADSIGMEPAMASDCHYANKEDLWIEEAMLIMATKPKLAKDATVNDKMEILEKYNYLYPDRKMTFQELELYLRSYETEREMFVSQGIDRLDIFENTNLIADRVSDYEMPLGLDLLPKPKYDPMNRLRSLVNGGLKSRDLYGIPEYMKRINMELDTIERMNNASYFLVVADMTSYCRSHDIRVGPGRGSAAGSLVLYALGITNVDPIKYNLLFARFLNEDRNDLPDIDFDIADDRRAEVKAYLTRKFKNVAGISTFTYQDEKQVIKDAASVLNVPFGDINKITTKINTFEEFELSPLYADFRNKYPDVLKLAKALRGRLKSVGMHAAGIVISDKPLYNYTSIETRAVPNSPTKERVSVVGNDMDDVANIGLVKFDLLGLKTLSIIDGTIKDIKERRGVDIVLEDIDLDDSNVAKDLSLGHTVGVFQAEKPAFTRLLKEMHVDKFDHIVAANALVRPGAMNTIGPDYVARKQGRMSIPKIHPIYDEITKDTYGSVLYQEQVMLLCNKLAGMSWSDADRIRKIIGKKKDVHEFDAYREAFISGASNHVTKEFAEKLWHDFEAHAGYSFNLSHSVAYSMLTMWTAWLKHYYPLEYMKNLLARAGKEQKTSYLLEVKRLGIKIYLPHINKSKENFDIEGAGIRFGFSNIKYISEDVGKILIALGPFSSASEVKALAFEKNNGINSRVIESLDKVGAISFSDNPIRGDESSNYWEYLGLPSVNSETLPDIKLDEVKDIDETGTFVVLALAQEIQRGSGWSRVRLVDESGSFAVFHSESSQVEVGSMYIFMVASNRIVRYINVNEINDVSDAFIRWLHVDKLNINDGEKVVLAFSSRKTKAGKNMATVVFTDREKVLESALVFNSMYPRGLGMLKPGRVVKVRCGTLDDGTQFVKEINESR